MTLGKLALDVWLCSILAGVIASTLLRAAPPWLRDALLGWLSPLFAPGRHSWASRWAIVAHNVDGQAPQWKARVADILFQLCRKARL